MKPELKLRIFMVCIALLAIICTAIGYCTDEKRHVVLSALAGGLVALNAVLWWPA